MEGCFNELETYVMILWSAVETGSTVFGHATSELQKYTVCEVIIEEMRGDLKK